MQAEVAAAADNVSTSGGPLDHLGIYQRAFLRMGVELLPPLFSEAAEEDEELRPRSSPAPSSLPPTTPVRGEGAVVSLLVC